MQELADALGVSKVTVFEHVEALIKKDALVREPNKARSLSLAEGVTIPDEDRPSRFPLLGKIAAGYPIEKFADADELDMSDFFGRTARESGCFALQVDGDSMKDEGIWDGDYVIVRRSDTAHNGERVVALLPHGETTLKRFYKEGDHIRLQPANDDFEPIIVKDCQIQGIVVGILRRY
jgi:repressor LexA